MRLLVLALVLLIPAVGMARDNYYKANPEWNISFTVDDHTSVNSTVRLTADQVRLVKRVYNVAEEKFLKYWGFENNKCNFGKLNVVIVTSHNELDSRDYFPDESTYADLPEEGTEIIFGRYFKGTNTLYIVPPNTNKYYWESNFAHELAHYFFDECAIKFKNSNEEHIEVERFTQKYNKFFK